MCRPSSRSKLTAILLALCAALIQATATPSRSTEAAFHTFLTRPDIGAPKWNVQVRNASAISPGYWFVAPYGSPGNTTTGPHIYDSSGELIWSGAPMFNGSQVFDFRVANVDGWDMITFVDPKQEAGIVLDENYNVHTSVPMGEKEHGTFNVHDFNVVGNASRALFVKRKPGKASKAESAAIGYDRGECNVIYDGFEERDLLKPDSEPTFSWSSEDHVSLEESALSGASSCAKGFDYFHANAVDKFPDGDYLLSARFTGTLYKISARDGSIVWRLGGKDSDFKLGRRVSFSAQGHARVQIQTESEITISLMDNAILSSDTTNDRSRGLLLLLRMNRNPMTAEVVAKYDHPHNEYANNQGDFQILPNGNAFLGWRDQALQSEHTPDGKVVMEASILPQLYSYRNFKFGWVGRPKTLPDVYVDSGPGDFDDGIPRLVTNVYVSWNGATEVSYYNVFRVRKDGRRKMPVMVDRASRQGFETKMFFKGYGRHIEVEALDADGNVLGVSKSVEPAPDPKEEASKEQSSDAKAMSPLAVITVACFSVGLCLGLLLGIRKFWRHRKPWWLLSPAQQVYKRLSTKDDWELDEMDEPGSGKDHG